MVDEKIDEKIVKKDVITIPIRLNFNRKRVEEMLKTPSGDFALEADILKTLAGVARKVYLAVTSDVREEKPKIITPN